MTLVFGLALLAAVGGLAGLLVVLQQRRFARMNTDDRQKVRAALRARGEWGR